jgi:hypothetical protein
MTTPERAEINRRNAAKSTGPRTPEGKNRSKFNALKHGMTAKTLVLPGEDAEAFQERIDAWTNDLQPRNDFERDLVVRAATVYWQLERADRADAARLTGIIHHAPAEEHRRQADQAAALGQRLFWDARYPLPLYPHAEWEYFHGRPRISCSDHADDPDQPARLLPQLEASAAGCRWLLDRWAELRALLDKGLSWQSSDKFKAIRLLGKQPLDAADDEEVAGVFLACHVIDPQQKDPFAELRSELTSDERRAYQRRLVGRRVEELRPQDQAQARAKLLALVDRASSRLDGLLKVHEQQAAANAAQEAARLSFDASPDGERLRRYQLSCGRSFFRAVDTFLKVRQTSEDPVEPTPAERADPDPVTSGIPPGDREGSTESVVQEHTTETAEIAQGSIETHELDDSLKELEQNGENDSIAENEKTREDDSTRETAATIKRNAGGQEENDSIAETSKHSEGTTETRTMANDQNEARADPGLAAPWDDGLLTASTRMIFQNEARTDSDPNFSSAAGLPIPPSLPAPTHSGMRRPSEAPPERRHPDWPREAAHERIGNSVTDVLPNRRGESELGSRINGPDSQVHPAHSRTNPGVLAHQRLQDRARSTNRAPTTNMESLHPPGGASRLRDPPPWEQRPNATRLRPSLE